MKVHVVAVIVKSVNRSTTPRDTDSRVSVKWSLCVKDWGSWPFLVALFKGPDDSLQNTVATWFHRSSADIWSHDTCCCHTKSWILPKCCHFKYTLCVCELVRECKDRQKFDWPPWKFMIFLIAHFGSSHSCTVSQQKYQKRRHLTPQSIVDIAQWLYSYGLKIWITGSIKLLDRVFWGKLLFSNVQNTKKV